MVPSAGAMDAQCNTPTLTSKIHISNFTQGQDFPVGFECLTDDQQYECVRSNNVREEGGLIRVRMDWNHVV